MTLFLPKKVAVNGEHSLLKKTESEGLEWIDLAYDRDQYWAIVNTVMNLLVPHNSGDFLTS
jgi:hypothetical protein